MPRFTQGSLEVDTFTAEESFTAQNLQCAGDFRYDLSRDRYLRISAYDCFCVNTGTNVLSYPTDDGSPAYVAMGSATPTYFYAHPNLPQGANILVVYTVHKELSSSETMSNTIIVRRMCPSGDSQLDWSYVPHSNGVLALHTNDITGINRDEQLTSDPSAASDFYMIELEYKLYLAGTLDLDFYFYGFILKYRMDTNRIGGAVLRERT
jgi:hypothetical protein